MKRRFSLLGTTAFRTAALSALLYAVLTGAIVAIVYPLVASQIRAQIDAGLQAESSALALLYDARGTSALARVIHNRSAKVLPAQDNDLDDPGRRYYALAGADGGILAGDLALWPPGAPARGWAHFHFHDHNVQALVTPLPGGRRLLVGQSLALPDTLARQAVLVVVIGAALALLAGLAGGAAVGARVMQRIRDASATAERIQAGHLGERLAYGGGAEHELLARAFNTMLERIEKAVLGLRDLAMRTAHEMRHPLARMDQALARAQATESHARVEEELGKARAEIGELVRRTEALLRLARLQSDHERREFFQELDLAALVTDVVELYAPSAEEDGHELRMTPTSPLAYSGDRQLLAQALANLLDNAIQHAAPGAAITVAICAGKSKEAIIEVGNAARRESDHAGTGFGLPIARAIAELHQGRLEIRHTGDAFTARLILPLPATAAKA